MSLYLIRSFGKGSNKTALKVGFTDNLKSRLINYRSQNPFFELISTRQGSELDECRVHLYLTALNYKTNFLNEWFVDCDDILQLFHKSYEKMNEVIWRFRDKLFSLSDIESNNIKSKVYEELRLIQSPLKKEKRIDKDWLSIQNKTIIKKFSLIDGIIL